MVFPELAITGASCGDLFYQSKLLKTAKEELMQIVSASEYYDAVYNSLGSLAEDMYELGYDIRDIEEREKHERYLSDKADILGVLCKERGIKLWEK